MTREEIAEKIIAMTADLVEMSPDEISESSKFAEDLEADSLDLAEMALQADQDFGIRIAKEDFPDLTTVGNVIDYIYKRSAS